MPGGSVVGERQRHASGGFLILQERDAPDFLQVIGKRIAHSDLCRLVPAAPATDLIQRGDTVTIAFAMPRNLGYVPNGFVPRKLSFGLIFLPNLGNSGPLLGRRCR
jgi:hypothetical protein